MIRKLILVLAFSLISSSAAQASYLWVSGFETPDNNTVGTTADSVEFPTANISEASGDSTATLCSINASPICIPHRSENGGGSGSVYALRVATTTGQTAYYELPSGLLSANTATVGFTIHQNAAPGVAYVAGALVETSNLGCMMRVNTDRTMSIFYRATSGGSSLSLGSTSDPVKLQRDYCSGVSCVDDSDCAPDLGLCIDVSGTKTCHNTALPCDADGDCPSSQTCGTCSTTTGANCYHAGIEITQINQGSRVHCEFRVNANLQVAASGDATTAAITSARWGVIDGPSGGSNTVNFDDAVITNEDRTGYGFISTGVPTTDYVNLTWLTNSCGAGTTYERCIDDWDGGGPYDTNATGTGGTVRATTGSRLQDWSRITSLTTNGVEVATVQTVVTGQTSGSASTGTLNGYTLYCDDAATCDYVSSASTNTITYNDSTHRVLLRYNSVIAPNNTVWSDNNLANFGARLNSGTVPAGGTVRVGGVAHYAYMRRSDAAEAITLEDHDIGPNDGQVTLCLSGDSTNGGTFSVSCQGGTEAGKSCGANSYCSDFASTADIPTGGCDGNDGTINSTDHYVCQTCQNRREEFGSLAGYPCGPNNGSATCNLGTCSAVCDSGSGTCCSVDTTVTCTSDPDCDLGDCDTCTNADCSAETPNSTCVDACLGGDGTTTGVCPLDRTAWSDFVDVPADNYVRCLGPGVSFLEFARLQASHLMVGGVGSATDACFTISGTGLCTCSTNADCDSGAGGTCTSGVCSGGNASTCTADAGCESGLCSHRQCDVIADWHGYNDESFGTQMTPDCTTLNSTGCMDRCPRLLCTADADCSSRSTDSKCLLSTYVANDDSYCYQADPHFIGPCQEATGLCNSSSDCPLSQTCTDGTPGNATYTGYCNCGADAQSPATCPSGYACEGGVCTRKCTLDANCGAGGDCVSQGAYSVCARSCTCPCNSTDMSGFPNSGACTKDSDCYRGTTIEQTYINNLYQGKCISGKCRCCGTQACTDGGACDFLVGRKHRSYSHAGVIAAREVFKIRSNLMTAHNDTDGGPTIIFATPPEPNSTVCALHTARPDHKYFMDIANHFMRELPHVMDFRGASAFDHSTLFTDDVHPNPVGGERFGDVANQYLRSLNVCAKFARSPRSIAVSYCKNNDGTWPNPLVCCGNCPGTTSACTSSQQCKVKTCDVNGDCSGTGVTCNLE
jgi:hypothetical protein